MKKLLTLTLAAAALACAPAFAEAGKPMAKPAKAQAVYCCKECKACFSEAQAAKMKDKDKMGHKLEKMAKVPAGYKTEGKM